MAPSAKGHGAAWWLEARGEASVLLGEGLQALESRVGLGQRPVGMRSLAVGMQGGHRPAPSGFQGVDGCARGEAEPGKVVQERGSLGHDGVGKKL